MTILFHSAQFILTPQDYPLLTTCCYLEPTLLQENVSIDLLAQKCGLQYQTIKSSITFTFKWKLKTHLLQYMKKIHNYIFKQHFTYQELNVENFGSLVNVIVCFL